MRTPSSCPSCGGDLVVTRLRCASCEAVVEGEFTPCPVCMLSGEDRELFELFMEARGNLKEVQRELGLSYPTVRSRFERMMSEYDRRRARPYTRMEVLRLVGTGEMSVEEAEPLLRRIGG
jgi:hypothetical protein